MSRKTKFAREIEAFVERLRSANDPDFHLEIAEEHVYVVKAGKRVLHMEAVSSRRGDQVILSAANKLEARQLLEYLANVWKDVPHGTLEPEDRERLNDERDAAMREYLMDLIADVVKGRKR